MNEWQQGGRKLSFVKLVFEETCKYQPLDTWNVNTWTAWTLKIKIISINLKTNI